MCVGLSTLNGNDDDDAFPGQLDTRVIAPARATGSLWVWVLVLVLAKLRDGSGQRPSTQIESRLYWYQVLAWLLQA